MTLALALLVACTPGLDEPARIAWDHAACDHCGMMISEPRYAAQMTTKDGQRYEFDDPACAFRYVADNGPDIAHLWFRDSSATDDVWLDWQQVEFVPARGTPMDGGVAAVPAGTEGAFSFSEASSRVLGGAR